MTVTVTAATGVPTDRRWLLPAARGREHEVKTDVNSTADPARGHGLRWRIVRTPARSRAPHDGRSRPDVAKTPEAKYTGTDLPLGSKYPIVTYTPAANYPGTDHFTFTATDTPERPAPGDNIYRCGARVNLPPMADPQLGLTTAANTVKPSRFPELTTVFPPTRRSYRTRTPSRHTAG